MDQQDARTGVYSQTLKRYAVVPILIVVIIVLLAFVIVERLRQEEQAERERAALGAAGTIKGELESQVEQLVGIARGLAGLVAGAYTAVPNHNGTKEERMLFIDEQRFMDFAGDLYTDVAGRAGVTSLQLQPSAVIAQVYPEDSGPIGLDLLGSEEQRRDVLNSISREGPIVAGPLILSQGFWGLIARAPVFVGRPHDMLTYWGNGGVVARLDKFLAESKQIADIESGGYDYILEFTDANTGVRRRFRNATHAGWDIQDAVYAPVTLPNGFYWDLYVWPTKGLSVVISANDIGAIVAVATSALALGVGLLLTFAWSAEKARRVDELEREKAELAHQINASGSGPIPRGRVGLLFTDIVHGTAKWGSAPEDMTAAVNVHNAIIREAVTRNQGCEVKTSGDSFFIVAEPHKVLHIAVDIQRKMLFQRWPEALGQLGVRIGLCVGTPEVTYDERGYDYTGSDVVRAATVAAAAGAGQILTDGESFSEIGRNLPAGVTAGTSIRTHGGQEMQLTEVCLDTTDTEATEMKTFVPSADVCKAYFREQEKDNDSTRSSNQSSKFAFDVISNTNAPAGARERLMQLRTTARVMMTAIISSVGESQRTAVIMHIARGLSVHVRPGETKRVGAMALRIGNRLAQICDGRIHRICQQAAAATSKEACGSCTSCLIGEACSASDHSSTKSDTSLQGSHGTSATNPLQTPSMAVKD